MKTLFAILFSLAGAMSAFGQVLEFKVEGQPDTLVYLVKYIGDKPYYADSAQMERGKVAFDGAKQQPGLMGLLIPGQRLIEVIYNKEDVQVETQGPDFAQNMTVRKSVENKEFKRYQDFLAAQRVQMQRLQAEIKAIEDKESTGYKERAEHMKAIDKEVGAFQEEFVRANADRLVGKMVRLTMESPLPDPPRDEAGNITDSSFVFRYYRDHFFDNFDFTDDGLVNTPVFGQQVDYYCDRLIPQHWDSIPQYAFKLIDEKLPPTSKAFEYVVTHVASTAVNSKIMGMDKVYVMMLDKYYCTKNAKGKSPAFWMTEERLEQACRNIDVQKRLMMGVKAPNIILPDTLDRPWDKLRWINMHKINAEYTVLYFWDHNCGHCKKITPKLAELYTKKLKKRNIEVFAIGHASGEDYPQWKEYIIKNKLPFINVAVTETALKVGLEDGNKIIPRFTTLESMNLNTTYDTFSTPRIFVLDKDKRFIAKQISVSQLEDMMDEFQGMPDEPKLFPEEQETEEDQQMKGN